MSVPATTLAVVVHAAGDLRVEEVPLRAPAAHEAVVRIAYGGVCGSDLHYWTSGAVGESVLRDPMVLGHEVSGEVLRAAADGSGPREGVRVVVHPATPGDDGVTRYPPDRPNLSPRGTYLGSAAHHPHTDGAFARHVVLPARMLRALPDGVDLRTAALAEPAAVAWHGVARAGGVRGRRALVVGAGPVGALVVAVLARAGAAHVTAVDLHEEPLRVARAVGADAVLRADDAAGVAACQADVVVESSGHHLGLRSALAGAARGGRVVMLGLLPGGDQPVAIATATTRELELVGSFRFTDEIDDVVGALADGSLDVAPVVTHVHDVEDAPAAFARALDSATSCKVLLRF